MFPSMRAASIVPALTALASLVAASALRVAAPRPKRLEKAERVSAAQGEIVRESPGQCPVAVEALAPA